MLGQLLVVVVLALLGGTGAAAQERQRPPFNPVITSLSPSSGAPGAVVDAVLRGMDLAGGTIHISGIGVRVLDVSVQDPTTHFLRLYIDPGAPPGPRMLTITVTSQGITKVAATIFSVSP
ncbi:MAG: hypothetical protein HY725_04295 [Candidatus Rokubacteria bacterium]|nr:hypothetical protein [Candidatus Rokubacteria bacterium]